MAFTPHTDEDIKSMLEAVGANSIDDLLVDIPQSVRSPKGQHLKLPKPLSEQEVLRHMEGLGSKNYSKPERSFLGAGIYHHFIPGIISASLSRQEFFTAYTPYQPEVSQGTLRLIFDFQSLMTSLTGLDVSNASLYDGATAAAEAANIAIAKTKRKKILIARTLHPEYKETIRTLAKGRKIAIKEVDYVPATGSIDLDDLEKKLDEDTAALIAHQPNFFGALEPGLEYIAGKAHEKGAFMIMGAYPMALPLIQTPGEAGADIAFGEAQCLGSPPNLGGPGLGYVVVKDELKRLLPGRVAGQTKEKIPTLSGGETGFEHGQEGYALTLATREQHIRREKATSNICSNQALCAAAAAVFAWYMGGEGMKKMAEANTKNSHYVKKEIQKLGFELVFQGFFNEFVVKSDIKSLGKKLRRKGIIGPYNLGKKFPELKNSYMFCVTDVHTKEDVGYLLEALEGVKK